MTFSVSSATSRGWDFRRTGVEYDEMVPTLEWVRSHRDALAEIGQRYGVSDLRVFGSVARGEAREGSDVDLLGHIESGRSLLDLIGFEMDATDHLGVPVEFISDRNLRPRFAERVKADEVRL